MVSAWQQRSRLSVRAASLGRLIGVIARGGPRDRPVPFVNVFAKSETGRTKRRDARSSSDSDPLRYYRASAGESRLRRILMTDRERSLVRVEVTRAR